MKSIKDVKEREKWAEVRQVLAEIEDLKVELDWSTYINDLGNRCSSKNDRLEMSIETFTYTIKSTLDVVEQRQDQTRRWLYQETPEGITQAVQTAKRVLDILKQARLFTIPVERVVDAYAACIALGEQEYSFVLDDMRSARYGGGITKDIIQDPEYHEFVSKSVTELAQYRNDAPFPTGLPFPSCFFAISPPLVLNRDPHNLYWELPDFFKSWDTVAWAGLILDSSGQAYAVLRAVNGEPVLRAVNGEPWTIHENPDQITSVTGLIEPETGQWGLPLMQSSWLCWQFVEMVRQCRNVIFSQSRPGRRAATKNAWRELGRTVDLPKVLRSGWKPSMYYEVPLKATVSGEKERKSEAQPERSGCPKKYMKNYHTDRRAHERVLVKRIKKSQPPEVLAKFKSHWLDKGWSIFENPCGDIEGYFKFSDRKCGLQPEDEIWAVEVVWVDDSKIGNLDAPYIPGNRSVWGDVELT
jgi:hypothetical protein